MVYKLLHLEKQLFNCPIITQQYTPNNLNIVNSYINYHRHVIGISSLNLPIYSISIQPNTTPNDNHHSLLRIRKRKKVVIIGRMLSGDSMSSWVIEGLLDGLLQ